MPTPKAANPDIPEKFQGKKRLASSVRKIICLI